MSNKENIILTKSYDFSISIIETYKTLKGESREFVLSKQLLRSGTSIGANIEEANGGYSRRDFRHKMSIAYKEARETMYWLRLLKDTRFSRQDHSGETYQGVRRNSENPLVYFEINQFLIC